MGGTISLPVRDSISASARESAASLHHVPVTGEAGEEEEQDVDEEGVGNGNDCAQWNGPAGVLQLPWRDRNREREASLPITPTSLTVATLTPYTPRPRAGSHLTCWPQP